MASDPAGTALNPVLATIAERHSVRMFADRPVADPLIAAVLQAANQAPSAHNQQSWRFLVVRERKKEELAELVAAKSDAFPRPSSVLLRMAARSIASAPVVIAVANIGELIHHGTELFKVEKAMAHDFFRTMEIQSSAAAVENLLLAATALGLSSVWLGILFLIKDDVLRLLGEREGEFMAVIPLGYAVRPAAGPGKRPLEATVRYLS